MSSKEILNTKLPCETAQTFNYDTNILSQFLDYFIGFFFAWFKINLNSTNPQKKS